MLNPMCCLSPRIGTYVFAILDLILVIPVTWDKVTLLINNGFHYDYLLDVVIMGFLVFLALLLLVGAFQNSQEKIRTWLMLWFIFLIIVLIVRILDVYNGGLHWREGGNLVFFLFLIYQTVVVYAYLVELKSGPGGLTYCPGQLV